MKYIAKLKLSKTKYLAILSEALVIVTTDEHGNPIRWAIFKTERSHPNEENHL